MDSVRWYIYSIYEGFWNNDIGWCEDYSSATIFSNEEKQMFNLPIGKEVRWYIIVPFAQYAGYEGQIYDGQGNCIK